MLFPLMANASWNDPTVVLKKNKVNLGEAFDVAYYNAPANAKVVVYAQKGSVATPDAEQAVAAGKGTVSMTIPTSAGNHGYYVVLCTGSGSTAVKISDEVLILADNQEGKFEMSVDKDIYSRGATITVTLKNAPACSGDQIVLYPVGYKIVEKGKMGYQDPEATSAVKESNGTVTINTFTAGYYKVYYMLEGKLTTIYDNVPTVVVGTPVALSSTKARFVPEEDIPIIFSGSNKKMANWLGVFPFTATATTADPLYTIELNDMVARGKVFIPAGTLPEGTYKIVAFMNGTRNTLSGSALKVTVANGTNSVKYSDAASETYYNIINAADNKCMTTEAVATSSAATKNMKLVTFTTQSNYAQWKLVKRENGKIDIINRATGDCLLSTSTVQGSYNYSKMGKNTETNNGFSVSMLANNQYAISSTEEDGVVRYLANVTVGGDPISLQLEPNSIFSWNFVEVETVVTSINGAKQPGESVTVQEGKIIVKGNQDYEVYNAEGIAVNKNSTLTPGIYLLKWKDGRNVKISVK